MILYQDLYFVIRLTFTFIFNLLVSNTSDDYNNKDSLLIHTTFVLFTHHNSYISFSNFYVGLHRCTVQFAVL